MAIIKGPICSKEARKKFSDELVFGSWRGINYVRRRWEQPYTNSQVQRRNRQQFAEAVKAYQILDCQEKEAWQQLARELDYKGNGYNLFISRYLGKNRV
ncbi:MAG: hypothetical protein ACQEQP_08220 [Bacillota bacterium]